MNLVRHRPLAVGPLRAFEAVARLLSFRAAAEELHLTQSAISRQIQALEQEIGTTLFQRGTRSVALTADGALLHATVPALLDKLDATVRQIRQAKGRRVVTVSTFASFASLWLIPRLEAFQREHPDIDIRVSAHDAIVDLADGEIDLALRYVQPGAATVGGLRLFGETLTPVISPWLARRIEAGDAPPLSRPADLAGHTLAEEDDQRPGARFLSWRRWLAEHGLAQLQPRRWMYLNFTYQQVQAALGGQAVALARLALVADALQRGDLIEPFGTAGRLGSPLAYWLMQSEVGQRRSEVRQFSDWILAQAAQTRQEIGEDEGSGSEA